MEAFLRLHEHYPADRAKQFGRQIEVFYHGLISSTNQKNMLSTYNLIHFFFKTTTISTVKNNDTSREKVWEQKNPSCCSDGVCLLLPNRRLLLTPFVINPNVYK